MSKVIVSNIRLRTRASLFAPHKNPEACQHEWEFHLWDIGDAYCVLCGSYATADNDPRIDRSGGHVRYHTGQGWVHAHDCTGCNVLPTLKLLVTLVNNLAIGAALCRAYGNGWDESAYSNQPRYEAWEPGCGRPAP